MFCSQRLIDLGGYLRALGDFAATGPMALADLWNADYAFTMQVRIVNSFLWEGMLPKPLREEFTFF